MIFHVVGENVSPCVCRDVAPESCKTRAVVVDQRELLSDLNSKARKVRVTKVAAEVRLAVPGFGQDSSKMRVCAVQFGECFSELGCNVYQ
jgi:hypothetical protein